MEPLLAINAAGNWTDSLVGIWNEVTNVAGLYCLFLSETLAVLIDQWLAGKYAATTMVEPNAPRIDRNALRFFVHPPSNLEELREMVAVKEQMPLPA